MKESEKTDRGSFQKLMGELLSGEDAQGQRGSSPATPDQVKVKEPETPGEKGVTQAEAIRSEAGAPPGVEKVAAQTEADISPYQGRVELKVMRPVVPALIRRLEKGLSAISGITYEGTWGTVREGGVLVFNLGRPLALLKTLNELPVVIKTEPEKTPGRTNRIAVTLGEKAVSPAVETADTPVSPVSPSLAPRVFKSKVELVAMSVVSVGDLIKFQTILNKNGIGKIGDISPLEDGSGSVFALELREETPLLENLKKALAGAKIEEENPSRLKITLPSNW